MTTSEFIEKVEEAKQLIEEAQTIMDEAMQDHRERAHYEAYGKYGFNQLLGNGNPYDSSLDSLIEDFEGDEMMED